MSTASYDPNQPRAEKGTAGGGRWISFTHASALEHAADPSEEAKNLNNLHYDKAKKKWVREDGEPVPEELQKRLAEAKVKPGLEDVALNPDVNGALQARGIDSKGRVQYMYSAEHSEANAAEKFARLRDFNGDLPGIRTAIGARIDEGSDAAAVLSIIEQTGIRVGSDRETGGSVKAYGASTLLGQHISLGEGGRVDLTFVGKHGQENIASLTDPKLHAYISAKGAGPNDRVFATSDVGVRAEMSKVGGKDYSPKDFRTWHGTAVALAEVRGRATPSTDAELTRMKNEVAKVVAKHLNNTPGAALKSYIDPAVFKQWGKGGKKS